jgi:uncharacterized alkaline shock family protein YloU
MVVEQLPDPLALPVRGVEVGRPIRLPPGEGLGVAWNGRHTPPAASPPRSSSGFNDAEFTADRGTTRIEDEVVEKIAGIAAREVPGVHDLGGDTTRFFAAVRERVGLGDGDQGNRGISVRLDADQARIGVTLVVEYGVRVNPVTAAVRGGVIKAVEEMLDLKVSEVDIVVDDVHVPDRPGF